MNNPSSREAHEYLRLTTGVVDLEAREREAVAYYRNYLDAAEAKYPPHMLDYPKINRIRQWLAEREEVTDNSLKQWRKARRLTQGRLAEYLSVSKQMVCMVEKGEKSMPVHWKPMIDKYIS